MSEVVGTVIGHRDGHGFVQRDDGESDIYLSQQEMHSVLHRDRVRVRVVRYDRRGRPEGRVLDIIESARPVPLSTSAMINKDELIALLEGAINHFPAELRESRWLLKERNEFLARSRSEAEEIIVRARARAERMVQRNEVVRAAEARARQIVESAEADARRMRLELDGGF